MSRRQQYPFEIELEVRDYECDLQGVVNNAVYLNYLEHARHRYLLHAGLDFARLHEQGCDLVLMRSEVDYLSPLRSGDRFAVGSRLGRGGRVRWIFDQEIFRKSCRWKWARAWTSTTCVSYWENVLDTPDDPCYCGLVVLVN